MATAKSRVKGMASMRKMAINERKKSTVSVVLRVSIHWINMYVLSL